MNLTIRIIAGMIALAAIANADAPFHTYLTWQSDTSTTITVNFHTRQPLTAGAVRYGIEPAGGDPERYPHRTAGTSHQIPGLEDGRWVHHVELTGLRPDTVYYAVAGDAGSFGPEFSFKTIPVGGAPIRFVTGGDMNSTPMTRRLLNTARKFDPMFGLIGGDIAYANGDLKSIKLWDRWLDNWETEMVTTDGRMIPMVLAIGNHETNDLTGPAEVQAPFYLGFFPQDPGKTHFLRRFGNYIAIVVLDSGHVDSHESQAAWLDKTLEENSDARWTMAIYHVPLYPSHRDFTGGGSVAGRTYWAPIFDKHHLDVAFENHDHTFKRTPRILNNRIDPAGTLYLGDGCFGVNPREVDKERRWYEEKALSLPHVWLVDAEPGEILFQAINANGEVFDEVRLP